MKKSLIYFAVMAIFTLSSCSKDDGDGGCQTCTSEGETLEICPGANGEVEIKAEDGTVVATIEDSSVGAVKTLFCQ